MLDPKPKWPTLDNISHIPRFGKYGTRKLMLSWIWNYHREDSIFKKKTLPGIAEVNDIFTILQHNDLQNIPLFHNNRNVSIVLNYFLIFITTIRKSYLLETKLQPKL